MVEAPGYCPPGPKCLFHPILYRHSQLPDLPNIRICGRIFKQLTNAPNKGNRFGADGVETVLGKTRHAVAINKGIKMKKISFALVGAASLALAACGGQGDDALAENVQENYENAAENLDAMAGNATGAEAATLGNQADALREEGARKEDAIDEADVNSANAVNAM